MIIGIGCDITHISKFQKKDLNFVDKILTEKEKSIYLKRKGKKQIEFLAGHFSAKESIIKAISNEKKINMKDIEILYINKKPYVINLPYDIHISISHDEDIVMTTAIITKKI